MTKTQRARCWPGLVLLAAACGGSATTAKLRIGLNPWPGYLDLAIADREGFFRDQGLDVQVVEFNALHDVVRSFGLGQIDIVACTLVEVLEMNRAGRRRVEIVGVVDCSNGADVVLARGAENPAQLRGKKIAYEPNSLGVYILARMLDAGHLTTQDVVALSMDQTEMAKAMTEGRIDAAITYPPTSLRIAQLEGTHRVFTTADIPDEVIDVIAVDSQVLDSDPTFLTRFYAAMERTERFAAEHGDRANATRCAVLGIAPETWSQVVEGIELYRWNDQARWIWGPDRIGPLAAHLHRVLTAMAGPRGPEPTNLTASGRPMPATLPAAAPR